MRDTAPSDRFIEKGNGSGKEESLCKMKNKRGENRFKSYLFTGLAFIIFVTLASGLYIALEATNNLPAVKTKKEMALMALNKERKAIEQAKKEQPELYAEPVEFYLKDLQDAYERASDAR